MDLGSYGIWQSTAKATPDVAVEAEQLGFGSIWVGASPAAKLTEVEDILDATERIKVATGIVNIWAVPAEDASASYHRLEAKHPGRFLLGVGIGHPEKTSQFRDPYQTTVEYLERCAAEGVPADRMCLAALGPKVLKLAAQRTAGAHPYLTTPRHTAEAREIVGPNVLLAPEHKVVLDTDPERARALARPTVQFYLQLVNYRRSLLRIGFTEDDLANGGSDRLVDALALHGDAKTVAAGLRAHTEAGANHVSIQVLGDELSAGHRALAEALELA
ncbi:MAG TPA: LLM class F420-dependent oxidoreductase [Sporichthyaceae bacterium]|jgi:probable F420-dependent oxidoreductase